MKQETHATLDLAAQHCVPCRGGVPPLDADAIARLLPGIPDWDLVDLHHLTRAFAFADFMSAQSFVQQVGEIAEQQGHHPDLNLSWGKVRIDIWTHKIDGLTESDFILAAKIDHFHTGC